MFYWSDQNVICQGYLLIKYMTGNNDSILLFIRLLKVLTEISRSLIFSFEKKKIHSRCYRDSGKKWCFFHWSISCTSVRDVEISVKWDFQKRRVSLLLSNKKISCLCIFWKLLKLSSICIRFMHEIGVWAVWCMVGVYCFYRNKT